MFHITIIADVDIFGSTIKDSDIFGITYDIQDIVSGHAECAALLLRGSGDDPLNGSV